MEEPLNNSCALISDSGGVPEFICHLTDIGGQIHFEGSKTGTDRMESKDQTPERSMKTKNRLKGRKG